MSENSKTARNRRGESLAQQELQATRHAAKVKKIRTNAGSKLNCIGDLVSVYIPARSGNNVSLELHPGVDRKTATARIEKTFSRGGEPVVFDNGKANVKFSRITVAIVIKDARKSRQRRAAA
tara:strand:- start:669 stop:1034 length:366 start_codon:yes stop_codon:yes gene_type:complete